MRDRARPGVSGLCLATYLVTPLEEYRQRVGQAGATGVTPILANEFGQATFSFIAPDGTSWNLIEMD